MSGIEGGKPTRKLGPWLAAFLVAGNVIGSGIYGLPATLGAVGSVSLLGWVVATIGALGAAVVFASLAQASKSLDGVVGYTEEGLSAPGWGLLAVLIGWALIDLGLYIALQPKGAEGMHTLATVNAAMLGVLVLFWIISRLTRGKKPAGAPGAELGRLWGFAVALIYWLALLIGNVTISVPAAGALSVFIPALASPTGRTLGVIGLIWVMTLLNLIGPRIVARFGGLTLVAGLIPVVLLATAGWAWFDPKILAQSWNVSGQDDFHAMQLSVVAAFWAYTGLESAAVVAAVVREPEKNVPFATLVGVGLAAVVYLSASTVVMGLAPAREYALSNAPLALAFAKIAGPTAGVIVAACAIAKISGTLGGWTLMTAETARAGADVHLFPGRLAPEQRDQVPRRILIGGAVAMSGIAWLSNSPTLGKQFAALLDVSTVWAIIPYILCALGLLRLAPRLQKPRARFAARSGAIVAIAFTGWTVATGNLTTQWLTLAVAAVVLVLWLLFGRRAWAKDPSSIVPGEGY